MAWTVVIRPSTIPNRSLITCKELRLIILSNEANNLTLTNKHIKRVMKKNLGEGSKAIGSATSIGNNVKLWFVFFLVNTDNKHRCIFAGSRNDNLLGTTLITTTIQIQITHISNLNYRNLINCFQQIISTQYHCINQSNREQLTICKHNTSRL